MSKISKGEFASLNRRQFLGAAGGALLATSIVSRTGSVMAQDQAVLLEAPELAELVAQGKLPALADRLPASPAVIAPVEGVGLYGGEWRNATVGVGDYNWWWRCTGYEALTRINLAKGVVEPNLAETYDVEEEGKRFVFHLRQGVKWSDGTPFTAHDVAFWYNDFLLNEQLWPAGPLAWMRTESGPGTVEAKDDNTVVFSFTEPNGFLPNRLATDLGIPVASMPKHYLSQFHGDLSPGAADLAKSAGFNSWQDMFLSRSGQATYHTTADLPVLRPWQLQTAFGSGNRLVFNRNPYYWKVDPNGSQLPYINRVVFDIIEDTQVMLLRALNGDFDYILRHINTSSNKPVLAQNAERGDYKLMNLQASVMNEGVIALNLTHNDPVKRAIYNNKDFRIGLSHALDRTEIINAVYQRQGEPWQAAPRKESIFYNETMAKQYTDFDLDLANQHLDEAGYKDRDAAGLRLGPDGKPIHISFLASTTGGAQEALLIDVQQIMKQQWAKVGIGMDTTSMERSLFITRTENEDQDALMWTGYGGHELTLRVDPRWYLPTTINQSNWAGKWARWYNTNGKDGETPPAEVQKQFKLYSDALSTYDDAARDEMFKEILQIAAEQFFVIGTTLAAPPYSVKTNHFMNVPEQQPDCFPYPAPGQVHCEQFWIKS